MLGSVLLASLALVELVSGTHIPRAGAPFNHRRHSSPAKRDLPSLVENAKATFYRLRPEEGGYFTHCYSATPDGESEYFVAMNTQMFNEKRDCGTFISIWGMGKDPVQAQILDSCPTCPTYGHIDMSVALMRYFDPTLNIGEIYISWSPVGSGGGAPQPEPEPTSKTPEWTPEPTSTWTPEPTSTWTPEPTTSETPSPTPTPSSSSQSSAPSSLSASLSSTAALPSVSLNATLSANGTLSLNSTATVTNATTATISAAKSATATVALPHVTVAHDDVVVVGNDGNATPDTGNFAVLNGLVANFGRIILVAASA